MFLVEPASGRQKAYGSVHELGAALRRGELNAQARIFHRATARWLPITVHPEYRRVAAEHERRSALALRMRQWTYLSGDPAQLELPADPTPGAAESAAEQQPLRSWLGSTVRRLRSFAHL